MTTLRPLIQQLSLLCDSILQELDRMERGETGEPVNGVSIVPVVEAQGSLVPVEAVKVIRKKPALPIPVYMDLWVKCREAVGMGREREMKRHAAAFADLHTRCMENGRWAGAAMVRYFMSSKGEECGYTIGKFQFYMDEFVHETLKEQKQREARMLAAEPGSPGDVPATPVEISEILGPLMAKLKSKARGFGSKGE